MFQHCLWVHLFYHFLLACPFYDIFLNCTVRVHHCWVHMNHLVLMSHLLLLFGAFPTAGISLQQYLAMQSGYVIAQSVKDTFLTNIIHFLVLSHYDSLSDSVVCLSVIINQGT